MSPELEKRIITLLDKVEEFVDVFLEELKAEAAAERARRVAR